MLQNLKQLIVDLLTDKSEVSQLKYDLKNMTKYRDEWRKTRNDEARQYEETIASLKAENRQLIDNKFDGHNDVVAIDFMCPQVTVFSIERIWCADCKIPVTLISYQGNDGILQDVEYKVSDDKHKALVVEFNASLSTKRTKGR